MLTALRSSTKKYILNMPTIHACLIIFTGLIAYSNSLHVPFHFDDFPTVSENPFIKSYPSFSEFLKQSRSAGLLTFALNHALHGDSVIGYHIANTAVHISNSLLVYLLVLLSFRTPVLKKTQQQNTIHLIALFSSLMFVSHPLQTQAVTYIAQRFASLATMFYLLSIVLYAAWRIEQEKEDARILSLNFFLYAASLISALLAIKTKEIAVTLPLVLILYEVMFFKNKSWKRPAFLILFILITLIIPLTLISNKTPIADLSGSISAATRVQTTISRSSYLCTQLMVLITYLRLLILPVNLNLDYDYPIYHSLFIPAVSASFLLLLVAIFVGAYLYSRGGINRLISFGIFWFLVTLTVESGFIPIADLIFEHRVYLPSVGFFIFASTALLSEAPLIYSRHKQNYKYIILSVAVVIIMFSAASFYRNTVWQSSISLWEDVTRKSPQKARGHYNLAREYKQKGLYEKAISEYELAISFELNPYESADAYNNIGRIYEILGMQNKAFDAYTKAIELNPTHSIAYNNLGLALLKLDMIDLAIDRFRLSIKHDPNYAKAHANLGMALKARGNHEDAEKEFIKATELGIEVND